VASAAWKGDERRKSAMTGIPGGDLTGGNPGIGDSDARRGGRPLGALRSSGTGSNASRARRRSSSDTPAALTQSHRLELGSSSRLASLA